MIKLKRGIWESTSSIPPLTINWLIGTNNGKLWVSEDGITFQEISSPFGSSSVNNIEYRDNVVTQSGSAVYAVGDNGTFAYSVNGQFWTTSNTGISTNIKTVSVFPANSPRQASIFIGAE